MDEDCKAGFGRQESLRQGFNVNTKEPKTDKQHITKIPGFISIRVFSTQGLLSLHCPKVLLLNNLPDNEKRFCIRKVLHVILNLPSGLFVLRCFLPIL